MIRKELRELIVSWLHQDRKVSENVLLVNKKSTKSTVYKVAADCLKQTVQEREKAQAAASLQSGFKYGAPHDSTTDHEQGSSFISICCKAT
jgi:hypothetical protein